MPGSVLPLLDSDGDGAVFGRRRASPFGMSKVANSTKQQIEGDLHDVRGTAKEAEGKRLHNPDLEAEGRTEKVAGIVQKKLGKLEKLIGK